MDFTIEFCPAAFKHGVSEADIKMVFDNAKYVKIQILKTKN